MAQSKPVLDVVLPIEPTVDEEAEPSYWLSFDVEPSVDPMPLESPLLGLVLGGSTRPLPSENLRDLHLPLVHGETMFLVLVVHVVQQRTCFALELPCRLDGMRCYFFFLFSFTDRKEVPL